MEAAALKRPPSIPSHVRDQLLPVARKVFWWGEPEEWIEDTLRFVAQVMTFGDLDDICTTLRLLGEKTFLEVLDNAPAGVFDPKSWTFWHRRYQREVPPLPQRRLPS